MLKVLRNKKGFTMIELMIVAIIVAILAVVLIPLMSGNKVRAYATECETVLGTIRTGMRVYYAEHDSYNTGPGDPADLLIGIKPGDLDGAYFREGAYTITATSIGNFTAQCDWEYADNDQKVKDISDDYITTIYADGTFDRNY